MEDHQIDLIFLLLMFDDNSLPGVASYIIIGRHVIRNGSSIAMNDYQSEIPMIPLLEYIPLLYPPLPLFFHNMSIHPHYDTGKSYSIRVA